MYYHIGKEITKTEEYISGAEGLVIGYIEPEELENTGSALGFQAVDIAKCYSSNVAFRTGVEVYEEYMFTQLKIIEEIGSADYDAVALFIKKDLLLIVDIEDKNGSTRRAFENAINRYPAEKINKERIIYAFIGNLIESDVATLGSISEEVLKIEEDIEDDIFENGITKEMLLLKNKLLTVHSYYQQLLDVTEAIQENDNDVFDSEKLMYVANISRRLERLLDNVNLLSDQVDHLQDAYTAHSDAKLNRSMNFFTILTAIFFPLTIIVGWYGMNFTTMSELTWKYGYVYVIILSIVSIFAVLLTIKIARKKHHF